MRRAVRELASAKGLAPQDGDTLRALKEKHPSAPENLSLPEPPDGSVVPAVATEEDVRKAIMSFRAGASGGPDGLRPGHLRSLVAHAWFGGVRIAPSIRFNRPGERHAER